MNDFWSNQPFREFLILVAVSLWMGLWGLLYYCPKFGVELIKHYRHNGRENLTAYITRFLPISVFRLLIFSINTLSFATAVIVAGVYVQKFPLNQSWKQWLIALALLWGGVISYRVLKNLLARLWQFVFVSAEEQNEMAQDHLFIEWIRAVSSSILFSLFLVKSLAMSTSLLIWCLLLAIWITIRLGLFAFRLYTQGNNPVYIFLYLCAHEILPLVYLGMGIGYILSSESYWAIYQ